MSQNQIPQADRQTWEEFISGSKVPPGSHQDLAYKLTKLEDLFYQFYGRPNNYILYKFINGRRRSHLQGEPHKYALDWLKLMWKGKRKALGFLTANLCLIATQQWVCIWKERWNWMQSYYNAQHSCSGRGSASLYQPSVSKLYPKDTRDELFRSVTWECNPALCETGRGT